jgi:DNA-binding NarL/FixJ family response regulator
MESAAKSGSKEDGQSQAPIRVFLVMKNRLLLEGLTHQLRRRGNFEVCGYGGAKETTVEQIARCGCDVVVMDFLDPHWTTLGQRSDGEPGSRIQTVVVGMELEQGTFLEAVRSGVTGYLTKDASAAEVAIAVRAVARGNAICPPEMCSVLFALVARSPRGINVEKCGSRGGLTLRQQSLMRLVAKGLTNKEIALQLHVSEFTVKNHMYRIKKQLDAGSRTEAVDVAQQCGYEMRY